MAEIRFTNFASGQLAAGINTSVTTLLLETGQGARFPSVSGGDYFFVTLEDAALNREIVKVTARSTDTLTIVRAQDNTTARSWSAGATVALRLNAAAIETVINNVTRKTALTGSSVVAAGTTAQRDGTPEAGYFRFNSSTVQFEGYNGTAWGSVGGGATGGVGNAAFYENDQTITANYTITSGKNAGTFGPVTINSGISVTVPSGSTWTVV
ncbi:MAG: hypothetical protein ACKOW0_00815 [Schleiferiaceae bacterium]